MPRVAQSDLKLRLVRTYTAAPNDSDPNTGGIVEGDDGTVNFKEALGTSENFTKGFVMGYEHNDTLTRMTLTPWVFDQTSQLWWAQSGVADAQRRVLFIDPTIGDGLFYFQGVKTAGGTVDGSNPLTFYAGAR